jgi:hypothetical protein
LGVQDEPLVILEGQSLELLASGTQVHMIQRDTPRDAPAPPDPHEEISSDFDEEYGPVA